MLDIFLDMDGVIVDLLDEWLRRYRLDSPDDAVYPQDIKSWETEKYVKCGQGIFKYLSEPGTWYSARPYDGAIDAVLSLLDEGHNVRLATTAWWTNSECYAEKLAWVDKWLPDIGRKNVIFIADKGLLRGDLLVDDKPENLRGFSGYSILFNRPWNMGYDIPRGAYHVHSWLSLLELVNSVDNWKNAKGDKHGVLRS